MERYAIPTDNRGRCIILDIQVFDDADVKRGAEEGSILYKKFCALGFSVTLIHGDVTAERLRHEMEDVAKWITEADPMLAVWLMSHGERGGVITSDGNTVGLQEIIDIFIDEKCPALKGKPRLFFIEACQDEIITQKEEEGVKDDDRECNDDDDEDDGCVVTWDYKTDLQADFLLSFATPPGYVCWWQNTGSPYVTAVIRELSKNLREGTQVAEVAITELLTNVAKEVCNVNLTDDKSKQTYKQMPCFVSTLTKKLFFPLEMPRYRPVAPVIALLA